MIQTGILNPQINFLLSRVRHTNTFVITDRGFPNWPDVMTVDISLVSGMPRVVEVVTAIRANFKIGKVFQAEEFLAANAAAIRESYDSVLKKRVSQAIGIIRTGDTARYGNLVLESA
jgi:D-ribose pyranase